MGCGVVERPGTFIGNKKQSTLAKARLISQLCAFVQELMPF